MRLFVLSARKCCALVLHAILLPGLLAGISPAVHAAQIYVTSNADAVDAGSGCTLRKAVYNANTNSRRFLQCAAGDDADAGGDVILLPPETIRLAFSGNDDDEALVGDIDIRSRIVIKGGGAPWTVLEASGAGRIFDVSSPAGGEGALLLEGVKISAGSADDQGGAVRVRDGAYFEADYVRFVDSAVTSDFARGGALYVGVGSSAYIRRSEFSRNKAPGNGASGGAIYCDTDCRLVAEAVTLSSNTAADAGGNLFVASDGDAHLLYTSVANGLAAQGAGIANAGALKLDASVLADNGVGSVGSDLTCIAGSSTTPASITGRYSFIESPASDCALPSLFDSRTSLGAGNYAAFENVFYETGDGSFTGAPSEAHRLRELFAQNDALQVPSSEAFRIRIGDLDTTVTCGSSTDQHGRVNRLGASCTRGALQSATISAWTMGMTQKAGELGSAYAVFLSDSPSTPAFLRIQPAGGIGEPCGAFSIDIPVAPGQALVSFGLIVPGADGPRPAPIFDAPAYNRPVRVCNLNMWMDYDGNGLLSPGEPTGGMVRVRVIDRLVTTAGFSTPEIGAEMVFNDVPVAEGETQFLHLTPKVEDAGFQVTEIEFSGANPERFAIDDARLVAWSRQIGGVTQRMSSRAYETAAGSHVWKFRSTDGLAIEDVIVAASTDGGTIFPIRCRPNAISGWEAMMTVRTTSPAFGQLVYGVRCTSAHVVSLVATPPRVDENGAVGYEIRLRLDTHALTGSGRRCLLDEDGLDGDDGDGICLKVNLLDTTAAGPGNAVAGSDYPAFAGSVTFGPDDTEKVVEVRLTDDSLVEGDEKFRFGLALEPGQQRVRLSTGGEQEITIVDDDQPVRELKAILVDVPSIAAAGTELRYRILVHNRGTEVLEGVRVEFAVDQPMWVRNLRVLPAELQRHGITTVGPQVLQCSLATTKRTTVCSVTVSLQPNMRSTTSSMEADEAEAMAAWRQYDSADPADVWKTRKDWLELTGLLVTADMRRPPALDVQGQVRATVSGGNGLVSAATAVPLTVDAPALNSGGGVIGFWGLLVLAFGVALRALNSDRRSEDRPKPIGRGPRGDARIE